MSLITSLHNSFLSLRNTETQLDVAASNVSNADKTGYTKKVYETDYTTTSSGTVPTSGTIITANYDDYLYKSMVEDATDNGYYEVISDYLSNYSDQLGETDDDSTLNTALDNLYSALEALSQTPDDSALKSEVIQNAELLTYKIRSLSSSVQDLRAQADQDIATSIDEINNALESLDLLNEKIAQAEVLGQSTADLEDERRTELETIASYMDIDYYTDSNNQLKIYVGGRALLDTKAYTLTYTTSNSVNSLITYPGGFSTIDLNGTDITSNISDGSLGALIELRDETLVSEQEKLDELATTLIEEMNALINEGASLPARTSLQGETTGHVGANAFAGTGSVRIATVDDEGSIINVNDIDLSTCATISDVISTINTAFGGDITATLNPNGQLVLSANNTDEYLALNQLDSDINGESFSSYFGLNNIFTGSGAEDIYVSSYLQENSDYLATSTLSGTAIAGETGITPGDSTLSDQLQNLLTSNVSFDAAGDFGAKTTSFDLYIDQIMSSIASQASNASDEYDTVNALYEQTKTSLENISGVNIDEEMARIIELESQYQAAATIVSTIQSMFDELIAAVR